MTIIFAPFHCPHLTAIWNVGWSDGVSYTYLEFPNFVIDVHNVKFGRQSSWYLLLIFFCLVALIYQNIGTKYSLLSLLLQFGCFSLKIFNDRLFKESFISKIPISDQTSLAISGVIIVFSFNARVLIDLKNINRSCSQQGKGTYLWLHIIWILWISVYVKIGLL